MRFEGAAEIKEGDLRKELELAAGSFVTPWQLQRDHEKILQQYRDKGFYSASLRDSLETAEDVPGGRGPRPREVLLPVDAALSVGCAAHGARA